MAKDTDLTEEDLWLLQGCLRQLIEGIALLDQLIGSTATDRIKTGRLTDLEEKLLLIIGQKKADGKH